MISEPDHLDLVRQWFKAFNRADECAIADVYHDQALWDRGEQTATGREEILRALREHFSTFEGDLDGGLRRKVRTLARIETGWVHAEWSGRERRRHSGEIVATAGYDHFLIEGGLIRRQREVAQPASEAPAESEQNPVRPPSTRHYPERPIVGVGAVIVQDGQVVLIRRRFEPLAGQWSLPGGTLELGETLETGVAREILEETGLEVEVGPVIEVFDRIHLDEDRKVRYHFVLIDYLCRPIGGRLNSGSDVDAAKLVHPADLPKYGLTPKAAAVIRRGLEMAMTNQR